MKRIIMVALLAITANAQAAWVSSAPAYPYGGLSQGGTVVNEIAVYHPGGESIIAPCDLIVVQSSGAFVTLRGTADGAAVDYRMYPVHVYGTAGTHYSKGDAIGYPLRYSLSIQATVIGGNLDGQHINPDAL